MSVPTFGYCYVTGSWLYCKDKNENEVRIPLNEVLAAMRGSNVVSEKEAGKLMEIVTLANMYYLITSDKDGRTLLRIYEDPSLSKNIIDFWVI